MEGEKWMVYTRFLHHACKKKDQYPGYDGYAAWAFLTKDPTPQALGFASVGTLCNPGCSISCVSKNYDDQDHYRVFYGLLTFAVA